VGQKGWQWEEIERDAKQGAYADRISLFDYVPDAEVSHLYRNATCLAMPSLYEGFGIPALEAMANGLPVVASNTSSLPEIIGDAGFLLKPDDLDAWATTMQRLIENESLREEYSRRGFRQVVGFSWKETARRTLAVYDALGSSIGRRDPG
jgi:glycosyltransferase involved in cell wall biosynthesis